MSTILYDAKGNKIEIKKLTEEVATSSLTGVRTVWHEAVSAGLTPRKLATMLKAAQEGDAIEYLTLAEEMEEREMHYRSVLSTRKLALAGIEPTVKPAVEDDEKALEIAADVRDLVETPEFADMLFDLTDGLAKGYSVCEINWQTTADKWKPTSYTWRDPRFFKFDKTTGSIMRLLDDDNEEGVELPPYKFVKFIPKLKSGLPIRGGLAMLAAWSYVFKSYTQKDWLAFVEAYGLPLRLGKYSAGASKEDIETLIRAVANIGTDSAAVVPQSMDIEFVRGGAVGGDRVFTVLVEWIDQQVSKAVLGQTMTADSGSSEAQSKVHNEVRKDILKADTRQLSVPLNRDIVRPYVDLNHGPQEHYPTVILQVTEAEDVTALVSNVKELVPLGLRVSCSEMSTKLGLSEPKEGEPVLATQVQVAEPESAQNRAVPTARATNAEQNPEDGIALIRDDMLSDWEEVMQPIIDPVRKLASEASSYEEFVEGLETLQGEMDSTKLIEQLAQLTFTARGVENSDAE